VVVVLSKIHKQDGSFPLPTIFLLPERERISGEDGFSEKCFFLPVLVGWLVVAQRV
jgi:hypothetical protein